VTLLVPERASRHPMPPCYVPYTVADGNWPRSPCWCIGVIALRSWQARRMPAG